MTSSEAINSYFQMQLTTSILGAILGLRLAQLVGTFLGTDLKLSFSFFNIVEFTLRNLFQCSTNMKATQVITGDHNDFSANTPHLMCFVMARGGPFFGIFDF